MNSLWRVVFRYFQVLSAAVVTGVCSGLACVAVRMILKFLEKVITGHSGLLATAASELPFWRRIITPVIGAVAATLILRLTRRNSGLQESSDYIEAVRFQSGRIEFSATVWRTLSSAFSVSSGAAVGREGSMIQFAASVVSRFGKAWQPAHFSLSQQVACGVAAAVATVYQAPIAGMFFAWEIVLGRKVWGKQRWSDVLPLLVAAWTGALTGHYLLEGGPLFQVYALQKVGLAEMIPLCAMAALTGILGPAYFHLLQLAHVLKKWVMPLAWGGLAVGLLSCIRTETWGNGDSALLAVMHNSLELRTILLILLLRLCATAICVGAGTVGGVFTPTLFAGSVIGLVFGTGLHAVWPSTVGPYRCIVFGIGCLLASVTHSPFMAAFMTSELTGTWRVFPQVLACCLVSSAIASKISPDSLYAVATPEPAKQIEQPRTAAA